MVDVIIILGGEGKTYKEGSLTDKTRKRVEKGVELYKKGISHNLILSGCWSFRLDYIPKKTEAESMKDYAISLDVDGEDIYLEGKSKDTIGNLYFTKKIYLKPNNWKNLIIVSSLSHLERLKYLCKKILGDEYKFELIGVEEEGLEKSDKKTKEDKAVLNFTKKFLENVRNGDDNEIERFIYNEHPIYAKNPKISLEEIKHLRSV